MWPLEQQEPNSPIYVPATPTIEESDKELHKYLLNDF